MKNKECCSLPNKNNGSAQRKFGNLRSNQNCFIRNRQNRNIQRFLRRQVVAISFNQIQQEQREEEHHCVI